MKILISCHWLRKLCGSETFTFTLAVELRRQGHDVDVFTFEEGAVSKKMQEEGIRIIQPFGEMTGYDIIFASHKTCVEYLKDRYPNTKIIQTVHGLVPKLEKPNRRADYFVSISEEVQNYLRGLGLQSELILNGVDCERFKPVKPLNDKLKNVLLLSNKWSLTSDSYKTVEYVCKSRGLNFTIIGYGAGAAVWDTERYINEADLVISMGRGVFEAIACGRNVIIAGYDKMVGFIDDNNYPGYLKFNVSGRDFHNSISEINLSEEFDKYNPEQGEKNRELALAYHNIKDKAKEYLRLCS